MLTVGAGKSQGIGKTWKAVLATDKGPTAIHCEIVEVGERSTTRFLTATDAPLARVRFEP